MNKILIASIVCLCFASLVAMEDIVKNDVALEDCVKNECMIDEVAMEDCVKGKCVIATNEGSERGGGGDYG